MNCRRTHRFKENLLELDNNQGGEGRHKCCGCAYEQGQADAQSGVSSNFRPEELDRSQAGTGRHKDAKQAYDLGYQNGSE